MPKDKGASAILDAEKRLIEYEMPHSQKIRKEMEKSYSDKVGSR